MAQQTTPRVAVIGRGAVGRRIVHYLSDADVEVVAYGGQATAEAARMGSTATGACDIGVIACAPGEHAAIAQALIADGAQVVSVSDSRADVNQLRALHTAAQQHQRTILIGAAFSPGYTCLLASHARRYFDTITELHVATHGTGGPACARQHHQAFKRVGHNYHDGDWTRRPGGSGRELCWFPGEVESADCYRAELPTPHLLVPAFPSIKRVSARMAATRRDRFTAWLPMLTPPHAEGAVGAVRVEARGHRSGVPETVVLGAAAHPAHGAAATATAVVRQLLQNDRPPKPGAMGLAEWADADAALRSCARFGVSAHIFEGSEGASSA